MTREAEIFIEQLDSNMEWEEEIAQLNDEDELEMAKAIYNKIGPFLIIGTLLQLVPVIVFCISNQAFAVPFFLSFFLSLMFTLLSWPSEPSDGIG